MVKRVVFYAIGAVVLVGIYLGYSRLSKSQQERDSKMNSTIERLKQVRDN